MSKNQQVAEMIKPLVEALDCELWGIEYLSQGKHSVLRIYIEKDPRVEIEDCEKVSRQVSGLLDVEDPISGKYTLEVSSPGMDRQLFELDQFQRFIGEQVAIKLARAFEGRKKFQGLLVGVEGDEIVVQIDGEEYLLPFETIDKANIVPVF